MLPPAAQWTPEQVRGDGQKGERIAEIGLGLAIIRDVAKISCDGGALEEREDPGGRLVRLRLPAAN
ncbi:hypothetical protein SAQ01S_30910 [Sphingomonas aquatilis NBRC 16722]|nr:hypothetical protein SAQ01S_30910 [Sphingomonas aquatilis NBRC 16722]